DRLRELARNTGAATIHKQHYFEIPPNAKRLAKDPNAKPTPVYKVKIFAESLKNPLRIKRHKDIKKEHKQWYYTQTDGNYLMAMYDNGKEKDFELVNTFQLCELRQLGEGMYPLSKDKVIKGKKTTLPLGKRNGKDIVLKPGLKLLLFEKSLNEI